MLELELRKEKLKLKLVLKQKKKKKQLVQRLLLEAVQNHLVLLRRQLELQNLVYQWPKLLDRFNSSFQILFFLGSTSKSKKKKKNDDDNYSKWKKSGAVTFNTQSEAGSTYIELRGGME